MKDKQNHSELQSGLFMLGAALLALLLANSIYAAWYMKTVYFPISIILGRLLVFNTVQGCVIDVLMVFFFLLVGLELKREMLTGVLADKKQILLPLLAAIGGMVAPAAVFLYINRDFPQSQMGWAIPSATDIAFAMCVLMLLGRKYVPPALKIFLLAIAIFDDIGAILIITLFYSDPLAFVPLIWVAGCVTALFMFNHLGVMRITPYMLVGIALSIALSKSGIHTTIAGVIVAMAIPLANPGDATRSPLIQCMEQLQPWVNYFVLPLFAFTAAGVALPPMNGTITSLTAGIALGLLIGKQAGILGTAWLAIKLGWARLPEGCNWRHIYGVSLIAGIGFTMSLFIGDLAFKGSLMGAEVKLGVLAGSLLSGLCGTLVLRLKPTP